MFITSIYTIYKACNHLFFFWYWSDRNWFICQLCELFYVCCSWWWWGFFSSLNVVCKEETLLSTHFGLISTNTNINEVSEIECTLLFYVYRLLDSLVVVCWLRVREVPGSIPSEGPRHTKDVIKTVPVVPMFSAGY